MLGFEPASPVNAEMLAHVVQTALTPVFLLSGIASLLGVLATRLARVSDRCHQLEVAIKQATAESRVGLERQFHALRRRNRTLDIAVLLATAGGGLTCAAALLLFVNSLRDATTAGLLYITFGSALTCTMGALAFFMAEVLLASRSLKERHKAAVRQGRENEGPDVDADVEPEDGAQHASDAPAAPHDAAG